MANIDTKELIEHHYHHLRRKRNILFKAFLISYVAVFVVWLISLTPFFGWAFGAFTNFPPEAMGMYMMVMFGVWKIASVVLFLIPALAIWWEMASFKRK